MKNLLATLRNTPLATAAWLAGALLLLITVFLANAEMGPGLV